MDRPWPVSGCVLIVDKDPVFWSTIRSQLQQVGCLSRVAVSHVFAIDLLKQDLDLKVVLLDQGTTNGQMGSLVTAINSIRSDVTIVGISASDRREDFAAVGVGRFLLKPWTLNELIDVLTPAEPTTSTCTDTRIGKADTDTSLIQFSSGQVVRIAAGPMEGWSGTVVAQRSGGRILLLLEGGVFLEIDQFLIESASQDD